MWTDPIVEELHKIREEHAKTFNYDLKAIFEDLKKQERQSGVTYVSLPIIRNIPKQPENWVKENELAAT